MGARFELKHANFLAYLTADGFYSKAPRTNSRTLWQFLISLSDPRTLISSTMGTPGDWTRKIANAAEREQEAMNFGGQDEVLSSNEVERRLDPLRTYFTGYDFYAMVLPSESESPMGGLSHRFFTEAAMSPHAHGLVLMPERMYGDSILQIVDPFPALRVLAETPVAPPAVVFWTRLHHSCALPLREAIEFFRSKIIGPLDNGLAHIDSAIEQCALRARTKRILHLSDLHFGTPAAARRRRWLKESLARELEVADRVVVTGDLFDDPQESLRESFDEFRTDVENITRKNLLVIPGNHDVRRKGNAFSIMGRNSEYITDLRWEPLVIDDDLQTVFLSFNSSETGNFAQGSVGERQRLDRSSLLNREVRRRPEVVRLLKDRSRPPSPLRL